MRSIAEHEKASRPLPALGGDSTFFWTSGKDGVLRILRCTDCATYVHPPVPVCPACLGTSCAPSSVSGRATVVSFTVNHQSWWDGFPAPYVIAIVELDEQAGLRLTTNVVDCSPTDVSIGMRVSVAFLDYGDVFVPVFQPLPTEV